MTDKYISLENLSRFKGNADKTYILRDSKLKLQEIIGNLSINGNLFVNGTTTTVNHENITVNSAVIITNNNGADLSTTLSGLAIKTGTDNQAYGIMFSKAEDDSVLLGLGTVAEDNSFSYSAGEGSPLAIRADSSELNPNHILSWDSENLKLIDSGILNSNVVTTNTEQTITANKTFSGQNTTINYLNAENATINHPYLKDTVMIDGWRDNSGFYSRTTGIVNRGVTINYPFTEDGTFTFAVTENIPTTVSELTNDAGYITNQVSDLLNYTTTADLNELLENKQDNLTAGTNIEITDTNVINCTLPKNLVTTNTTQIITENKGSEANYYTNGSIVVGNYSDSDLNAIVNGEDPADWDNSEVVIGHDSITLSDYYNGGTDMEYVEMSTFRPGWVEGFTDYDNKVVSYRKFGIYVEKYLDDTEEKTDKYYLGFPFKSGMLAVESDIPSYTEFSGVTYTVGEGAEISYGDNKIHLPIIAGDNVTIAADETNSHIKISSVIPDNVVTYNEDGYVYLMATGNNVDVLTITAEAIHDSALVLSPNYLKYIGSNYAMQLVYSHTTNGDFETILPSKSGTIALLDDIPAYTEFSGVTYSTEEGADIAYGNNHIVLPIIAGDNVTIAPDETNTHLVISSTGGESYTGPTFSQINTGAYRTTQVTCIDDLRAGSFRLYGSATPLEDSDILVISYSGNPATSTVITFGNSARPTALVGSGDTITYNGVELATISDLPRSITLTPTPSDDGTIYGTVGSSDLSLLQASDNNYVTLNGKLYRLSNKQSNKQSPTLSYTNTDIDSSGNLSIGTIIVTISGGAWRLYESEMAGSSDITNIFS